MKLPEIGAIVNWLPACAFTPIQVTVVAYSADLDIAMIENGKIKVVQNVPFHPFRQCSAGSHAYPLTPQSLSDLVTRTSAHDITKPLRFAWGPNRLRALGKPEVTADNMLLISLEEY